MKKNFIPSLFITLLVILTPLTSQAWNATGHMVVAKIAYDNLTPSARSQVDQLTQNLATEFPTIHTFIDIAPWPDQLVQQQDTLYSHWHYVDIAFTTDASPLINLKDTDNAIWAIEHLKTIVHNKNVNPYERARALAFLVHIVGDIHQPLHTVSRISLSHPNGDQGGNLYPVAAPAGMKVKNLHIFWDIGLGMFDNDPTAKRVSALAQNIVSLYPENYFTQQVRDLILKSIQLHYLKNNDRV